MRRARVDRTQAELTAALRRMGASVTLLHRVGQGCPDAVVGIGGRWNVLTEFKTPTTRADFTPDQRRWREDWRGAPALVLADLADLERLAQQIRKLALLG